MNPKFYEVTKGPALKTIREHYDAVVSAYKARAKLGRKYKAKEVVSCEGTKEGKAIDKELYNPDTFSPYARSLAVQLGMKIFFGSRLCSPGCIEASARRYLLACLDPDWQPPEGVKRITDVEYERSLARLNKKVAK